MKLIKAIPLFILITTCLNCYSQTEKVSDPSLEYSNNKVIINYDLNGDINETYHISLVMKNNNGDEIIARSLTGDIGSDIKAGNNKTIIWNIEKDSLALNDWVWVKVIAQLSDKKYSKGSLILRSAVWPGWGQSKLKKEKPYLLIGVAGSSCIAGSIIFNSKSIETYDNYKAETDNLAGNELYSLAIKQDKISDALFYSAVGIWVGNIVWMIITSNNEMSNKAQQPLSFKINPYYYNNKNYVAIGLTINL